MLSKLAAGAACLAGRGLAGRGLGGLGGLGGIGTTKGGTTTGFALARDLPLGTRTS